MVDVEAIRYSAKGCARCQVVFGQWDVGSGFGVEERIREILSICFCRRELQCNCLKVFMSRYLNYLVGKNSTILQFLQLSFPTGTVVCFA